MSKEINKFIKVSPEEYHFYEKKLCESAFDYVYKKFDQQNPHPIKSANKNISKDNPIIEEEFSFLARDISLVEKERMLIYFSKESIKEKLNPENDFFKGLTEQVESIDAMIEPIFQKLKVGYKIYLTGGALRDHLLNKTDKVKDLDILIEFAPLDVKTKAERLVHSPGQGDKTFSYEMTEITLKGEDARAKFLKDSKGIFDEYDIKIDIHHPVERILHEVIFQTIKKVKDLEVKSFVEPQNLTIENKEGEPPLNISDDDTETYSGLFSVIKINSKEMKYPVDLLLNNKSLSYISSFDFNICKCIHPIKPAKNYATNISLYPEFIKDVITEKMSLNSDIFENTNQVDKCLGNHFVRLLEKYPTYKVEVIEGGDPEIISHIEKSLPYYSMSNKFPAKGLKNKATVKI